MAPSDIQEMARILEPQWNKGLIAGSIAISFLGAFTSTQLMVQAKTSRYLTGILVWGGLSALIFGFCSVWSLHFVAMLACELDVPIGLDVSLTILSAGLAVIFTFCALNADLLRDRYKRTQKRPRLKLHSRAPSADRASMRSFLAPLKSPTIRPKRPLFQRSNSSQLRLMEDIASPRTTDPISFLRPETGDVALQDSLGRESDGRSAREALTAAILPQDVGHHKGPVSQTLQSDTDESESEWLSSDHSSLRRTSFGISESDGSSLGLPRFASINRRSLSKPSTDNVLRWMANSLWRGLTLGNVAKGCLWSVAITSMHYVGIMSLQIPQGRVRLHPLVVIISAMISALVCTLGAILMAHMEFRIAQQILFAIIATAGVAAMHFTGMKAVTFESRLPPSIDRGYPYSLPVAIASIAITTCLVANFLLAHSATMSRNKLVEVVHTKKKMWAAIAQKENAEAVAAARAEFIASASHEIRTPLHHLVGHADLLSRTELTDEGRLLLYAMQEATHALSMITNSVLDWSRLEKGESPCRPTALNVRTVCEAIIHFLPAPDEDSTVDLMLVVAPDVPASLLIDETYLHRIMNNLVSNACKFTGSGYVQTVLTMDDGKLVVQVRDTGDGIPEAFLPDLWEPFKQAQSRGAHRGTGLGLSIVQQLLQNMGGSVRVDTRHKETPGVEDGTTGTTFTVEMPIQPVEELVELSASIPNITRIAIIGNANNRQLEGICEAWKTYEVATEITEDTSRISSDTDIVWADIAILMANDDQRKAILEIANTHMVLVPYENERTLFRLFRSAIPNNIVPIKKPFVWHKIMQRIAEVSIDPAERSTPINRLVRFASQVEVLETIAQTNSTEAVTPEASAGNDSEPDLSILAARTRTILLVEDNKINQRMGTKMVQTLGHDVLVASDGQEALDMLAEHDELVDAILMDQSMPIMDGLTATREIRRLEKEGKLTNGGRGSRRPIIAVTAVVGPHAENLCREAGTDAFLAKPLSLERLRSTLDLYLTRFGDESRAASTSGPASASVTAAATPHTIA